MTLDIRTYVVHYTKLTDRKTHMVNQLEKYFSNYLFYEKYDKDDLTEKDISDYYVSSFQNLGLWQQKTSLWGTEDTRAAEKLQMLNMAEISVTIKFGKILQELSQFDDEMFIVFDNDVILCDNFDLVFEEYMKKTPEDWDAIYFGGCAGLVPANVTDDVVAYPRAHPASRCLDSVVLKNKTVKELAKAWFPFNLISDWEIAYQHYAHNHKIYWWHPSLTLQGSETGLFPSSVNENRIPSNLYKHDYSRFHTYTMYR